MRGPLDAFEGFSEKDLKGKVVSIVDSISTLDEQFNIAGLLIGNTIVSIEEAGRKDVVALDRNIFSGQTLSQQGIFDVTNQIRKEASDAAKSLLDIFQVAADGVVDIADIAFSIFF